MNEKASALDSFHLQAVLAPNARKLGERCGAAAVDLLTRRLVEYLGELDSDQFSYMFRSAIEEHEQDRYRQDARSTLIDALRDAALGASALNTTEAMSVAKSLLASQYPTIVRIGIYVCAENFGTVGAAFWDGVSETWFTQATYWHEVFWYIRKCFTRFTTTQRNRYLAVVADAKVDWNDDERRQELDERHRRDLLHPAFGQGDAEVDKMYVALTLRHKPVGEHPDFHTYMTSGWRGNVSPVDATELATMPVPQLVAVLKGFIQPSNSLDGPTNRGLAESLAEAVVLRENGFAGQLHLFADMPRPYQHGMLRGLHDRLKDEKRDIDWSGALSLMQEIVGAPRFQEDLEGPQPAGWEPSVQWVLGDIANLLKAATQRDGRVPADLYVRGRDILRRLLEVTVPTSAETPKDAVSHAINAPRGRTLETLIHLALAQRRFEVAQQRGDETWPAIEPLLNQELATAETGNNADFSALAAMYCANLHYLSPSWTEANFDRIFSLKSEFAWACAAQGFAYQRYVYEWLYKRLVAGGHMRRMLNDEAPREQVREKALQFLGVAYLQGTERLKPEGLLYQLVATLRVKPLSQLCWFFWTLRGEDGAEDRAKKILAFWALVDEQMRVQQAELPELRSALTLLIAFVNELPSSVAELVVATAPFANVRHHGYVLLENLARLASDYPKEVAAALRAALTVYAPDFRSEDAIACVEKIAAAGELELAEVICNEYFERGSNLLRPSYDDIVRRSITARPH